VNVAQPSAQNYGSSLRQLFTIAVSGQRTLGDQGRVGAAQADVEASFVTLDSKAFAKLLLRRKVQNDAHSLFDVGRRGAALPCYQTREPEHDRNHQGPRSLCA
jgi:hypothetical protein